MRNLPAWLTLCIATLFAHCHQTVEVVSPPTSQIVFVSNRANVYGGFQVYSMDSEGDNVRRLTHDSNNYFFPRFSPDGTQILFYSVTGTNDEIYSMDPDGEHFTNLSNAPGNDQLPQFSPDGSFIAFTSDRDGNREIYIMNRDGSQQTRLTNTSAADQSPQFSPDGKTIIFYSSIDNPFSPDSYDIYRVDLDGTHLTKLTPDSTYHHQAAADQSPSVLDAAPRFSPDGSKIAFQSYEESDFFITMINGDGSNPVRLVHQPGGNFAPIFYPDGSQVLFRSHRSGYFEFYRMEPREGAPQVKVTGGVAHPLFGDFSKDGSTLLYSSNLNESYHEYYHIYIANADGSQSRKLTGGNFTDYFPSFSPRH